MKTFLKLFPLVILFTLFFNELFSQSLVPGVYRYKKDQNEVKVTLTGSELTLKGWRMEVKCSQAAPNKYKNSATMSYVEVVSQDLIILGNEKYNTRDELILYAPDNIPCKEGLTRFTWKEDKYYAMGNHALDHIAGEYLYEGKGEPKVLLKPDMTGYFQRHQTKPTPIVWWGIETNYKGEIQKLVAEDGRYKMMLVVKYGPGGEPYVKEGDFDRMQIMVFPGERKTVIMGERILKW